MNLKEFTERYACTLHTDTKTLKKYIKLPIADLDELSYMQRSLLQTIKMLTEQEREAEQEKELESSIYWISKILLASYPQSELEGLSKILKN